jgi:hypothetical protein
MGLSAAGGTHCGKHGNFSHRRLFWLRGLFSEIRFKVTHMQTIGTSCSVSAKTCSDIQLKVATTRKERRAAFELVYRSYRRAGLCAETDAGMRITPYQLLPTTDIINATLRGEVISTLSLVHDGELGIPMEEIYPEEVALRRDAGVEFAEVSCLADRRQGTARFFDLFVDQARLMAQLASKLGVTELLVVVHPRHAPIYRRYMAFEQIGDLREYPTVESNPAVALSLNFAKAKVERFQKWHEFFGQPLPDDALQSCPISSADRDYFWSILDQQNSRDECLPLDSWWDGGSQVEEECLLCA